MLLFLKNEFEDENPEIIEKDFLKFDINLTYPSLSKILIIGNFPYNISSQILFKAIDNYKSVSCLVGMFQKEVAERIVSNIKQPKKSLKNQKTQYKYSDFQKSERDFAFVLDKNFKVQELIEIIRNTDKELIKSVKVFDVYEGENIDEGKKSIALNVTIQSLEKTLNEEDLNKINQLIISTVESKTDAKIRS